MSGRRIYSAIARNGARITTTFNLLTVQTPATSPSDLRIKVKITLIAIHPALAPAQSSSQKNVVRAYLDACAFVLFFRQMYEKDSRLMTELNS